MNLVQCDGCGKIKRSGFDKMRLPVVLQSNDNIYIDIREQDICHECSMKISKFYYSLQCDSIKEEEE